MLTVVTGGQFGSEAKGAVSARLCADRHYDYAVRVGGPNAGHSVVGEDGTKYALRQLPVAAVVDPDVELVIAGGSEIDPEVLRGEIELLEANGIPVASRLTIDGQATVLTSEHAAAEREVMGEGHSTKKGIGAARAARAMRRAGLAYGSQELRGLGSVVHTSASTVADAATSTTESVFLEGTQGYGLGSHAGYYPYCTSGDCRAIDFMAAAGLPPMAPDELWIVMRMHPIRIAGDSGPLAGETTWDAIGVPPEYTTVTLKERRVGEWDWQLAVESVNANRPVARGTNADYKLALMFADYRWPKLAGASKAGPEGPPSDLVQFIVEVENMLGIQVGMIGTGPATQIRID